MRRAHTLVPAFALIVVLSLLSTGVTSQELPGRVTGSAAVATSTPLTTASGSSSATVDVLFARNSKGPYALSWKPVDRFSERVLVDGHLQQREFDYDVDYASGNIAFREAIGSSSVIRVEYTFDQSRAVRNRAPIDIPLTLDLLSKDNANLKLIGLYKADQDARSPSDISVLGVSGGATAREGSFTSTFLFNPDHADHSGRGDASVGDRSVLQLDGSTRTDNFRLSTKYVKVGDRFSGAREYKLHPGSELMDVAMSFNPTDNVAMTSSFKRTESPSVEKMGHMESTSAHKIEYTPDGAPKLTVARTELERERPGANTQRTTTDSMRIEHSLSPEVSAVATRQDVTTLIGESETRLVRDEITVGAKPSDNLAMTGRFVQEDSSHAGKETGIGFDVQATPMDRLSVKAALTRMDSEKTGEQKSESISLRADPDKNLKVEASLIRKETEATGSELAHAVKVVSSPLSDVQLELGLTGVSADQPRDEASRAVKLSTTALKNTRVQLDLSDRDSEVRGSEELRGMRVETSPSDSITFSGYIAQRDTADAREITREARLDLTPFDHTQVGGAIREQVSNGSAVTRITEVRATTRAIDSVELSGAYKSREAMDRDALDSIDMALRIDMGGPIKLTAAYARNPEDKKGVVQELDSKSIGLITDMGRLRFEGAFSHRNEHLAGRRTEKMDLAFDYCLTSDSLLTTSYTRGAYATGSEPGASILALGYERRVGSRMNLYLGARMTSFDAGRTALPDPAEYQAEARFGLRF